MYLIFLIASVIAGAIIQLVGVAEGAPITPRMLGETVGSIIALFAVTSFFPTIWSLISWGKEKNIQGMTIIGLVCLSIFAYFSFQGAFYMKNHGYSDAGEMTSTVVSLVV